MESPFRGQPDLTGIASGECKYKHKCIDLCSDEKLSHERPYFWNKKVGLTRGVPLYMYVLDVIKERCHKVFVMIIVIDKCHMI